MYRKEGNVDGDTLIHIRYRDGTMLTYPDDVDQIKLTHIENAWYISADDCADFTYDFIGTAEQYDFIFNVHYAGNPLFRPTNPLILGEADDYGWIFEKKEKPAAKENAA